MFFRMAGAAISVKNRSKRNRHNAAHPAPSSAIPYRLDKRPDTYGQYTTIKNAKNIKSIRPWNFTKAAATPAAAIPAAARAFTVPFPSRKSTRKYIPAARGRLYTISPFTAMNCRLNDEMSTAYKRPPARPAPNPNTRRPVRNTNMEVKNTSSMATP